MRGTAAVAVVAVALTLSGCASILDIERARRALRRAPSPAQPEVEATPTGELPPPNRVSATSGELRSVPLTWEPLLVGDVAGYEIERAPAREGPFERIATVPGRLSTGYVDAEAVPADGEAGDGVTFFYRVRAFGANGKLGREASSIVHATTAAPPDPPTGLRAYSHQPRSVPLSWQASSDPLVEGYVIERSPTSVGPFEPLAELHDRHATSHVDRGLGDLRVVYYRVASRNPAGGLGPPSEPVQAVTKAEPLPPIGLRVIEQLLAINVLSWDPNVEKDIASYRLLRKRASDETPVAVTTVPGDMVVAADRAVGAHETVEYSLVAIDRDGLESDPGRSLAVEAVGYDLQATVRPDGIHLEWNGRAAEGYKGARVYRSGWLGQGEIQADSGSETVDPDVEPGKTYRYTVALIRPDGTLAPRSQPVEIRVPKR